MNNNELGHILDKVWLYQIVSIVAGLLAIIFMVVGMIKHVDYGLYTASLMAVMLFSLVRAEKLKSKTGLF